MFVQLLSVKDKGKASVMLRSGREKTHNRRGSESTPALAPAGRTVALRNPKVTVRVPVLLAGLGDKNRHQW